MQEHSFIRVLIISAAIIYLSVWQKACAQQRTSNNERIYLHLDNAVYTEGDTVHFQGYVLAISLPEEYTKNLNVDWFGSNGSLLAHQTYPVVNGTVSGQWVVPNYYEGGSFKVVAYTQTMLQTDSSKVFYREVPLLGRKAPKTFRFDIFPEGGNLVAAVINRVGFHAEGIPPMEMRLVSSAGDTVAKIHANGNEYGSFDIVPRTGTSYRIALPIKGMDDLLLPAVKENGIAMQAMPYPNSFALMLRRTKNFPGDTLVLVGLMQGDTVYRSTFSLKGRDSGFIEIKTDGLPMGEMDLVLMDKKENQLAYRQTFVPGKKEEGIPFFVSRQVADTGRANFWQLHYGDSIPATVSVSIRDAVFMNKSSDMKGWLTLGRDIPDSLLDSKAPGSLLTVDDIVRCSKTPNVSTNRNIVADRGYFSLSGKVSGKKLPQEVSLILRLDDGYQPINLPIDSGGRFRDSNIVLFDSGYVALAKGQEKLSLVIDTLPSPAFQRYPFSEGGYTSTEMGKGRNTDAENKPFAAHNLPPELSVYGDTTRGHHLLPQVVVQSKKWRTKADSIKDIYMSEQMQTSYPNGYDVNLDGDPSLYMGGATLWDIMQGKIPGYDGTKIPFYNPVKEVYLDEVPIDREGVKELQLPQIAFVHYIRKRATSLTGRVGEDVLLIYSKKYTDPTLKERLAHNWGKSVIGYTSYIPFGQSFSPRDKNTPDRRKTLYWQPGVTLSKENPTLDIRFETNSIAKKLLIVVEGVKADGTPIHYEQVIDK